MAAAAAMMADQLLESRVVRLELDIAHVRSELAEMKLREERANRDREFNRVLAVDGIWMLLQTAMMLVILAHGFK